MGEPERQTCEVKEYLAAIEAEIEPNPDRKPAEGHLAERPPNQRGRPKPPNGCSSDKGSIT